MLRMFKIIQKLAPAPPTGVYSPVSPLNDFHLSLHWLCSDKINRQLYKFREFFIQINTLFLDLPCMSCLLIGDSNKQVTSPIRGSVK